jgi:hypothetical protein
VVTLHSKRKCVKTTRGNLKNFGSRLREALADAGRDQKWLADNLKPTKGKRVRDATVSAWVTGASLPEGDYMVQLPKLLNCNGHWLMTGEGPKQVIEPGAAEKRLELMKEVADAPLGDLQTVLEHFYRLNPDDADKGKNSA